MGLMSGTSLDGIDVVVADVHGTGPGDNPGADPADPCHRRPVPDRGAGGPGDGPALRGVLPPAAGGRDDPWPCGMARATIP